MAGRDVSSSLRRRIVWIAAGIAVAYGLAFTLLALRPRDSLQPFVPELRAAGVATTWDEYLAMLPPRRKSNGAALLAEAVDGATAQLGNDGDLLGREREWSADDRARAAAVIPSLDPWFAKIAEAAACDEIAWVPGPMQDYFFGSFDAVRTIQDARRLLAARRALAASSEERLRDSRTTIDVALRFSPAGLIDHALQRALIEGVLIDALRHAESGAADACNEVTALAAVAPGGWAARGRESTRTELSQWVVVILMAERGDPPSTGDRNLDEGIRTLARLQRCEPGAPGSASAYVRARAAADAEKSSPADWLRRNRDREASFKDTPGGGSFHLIGLVTPHVAERALRTDAVVDLCRIAAADGDVAAAERAAGGAPLRDPYTGRPYTVERTATHLRLASQGRLDEDEPLDEATLRERGLLWEIPR